MQVEVEWEDKKWYKATVELIDAEGNMQIFYPKDGTWEPWTETLPPNSRRVRPSRRHKRRHPEAASPLASSPLAIAGHGADDRLGSIGVEAHAPPVEAEDAQLIARLRELHAELLDCIALNHPQRAYKALQALGPLRVTELALRVTKIDRFLSKLHSHSDQLIVLVRTFLPVAAPPRSPSPGRVCH